MSKIIAVDFDGTLCELRYPEIGDPRSDIIAAALAERERGAKLILNTCRTGVSLRAAVEWCKERGLIFDAVNENLPERIALFGGDCRKISADEYWDDKAVPLPQIIKGVNMKTLGERISELRKEKGITQQELAEKFNLNSVVLNYYEKDARIPRLDTIIALARFFDVSTDYLLGMSEFKTNNALNELDEKRREIEELKEKIEKWIKNCPFS